MSDYLDQKICELFAFDMDAAIETIAARIRYYLRQKLRRRGLVIAISGGVDSAVCAALAVRSVTASKVFGLLMPERDSSPESLLKGKLVVKHLGIEYLVEDIGSTLESIGCYRWRDEAMRAVFSEYQSHWKSKIAISGGADGRVNHFKLIVADDKDRLRESRLGLREYLQIVAATNFKQRIRKTLEFFHADRLNYAVLGTPNRVEYDQGFFVRNGDGSADLKPIAHLYKSQVYMLARYFALPAAVCDSMPSTDTYSLAQGQDEFYFALPYREMDIALWHYNQRLPASRLAQCLGISIHLAEMTYRDIENKRRTTAAQHWPALLVEKVVGPSIPAPQPELAPLFRTRV